MATEVGRSIPASRLDSSGIWFTGSTSDIVIPGNGTTNACSIWVPFAHRLRTAEWTCEDVDNVGALTVNLMQADEGDAKAGTSIHEWDDTDMASTSDVISLFQATISDAEEAATTAGRRYYLAIVGDNAGDGVEAACLSICVEPVTRSTL